MPDSPRRVWAVWATATIVLHAAIASVIAAPELGAVGGSSPQESPSPQSSLARSIAEGFTSVEAGRFDEARRLFERAIEQAKTEGDIRAEAEANRGLGRARSSSLEFADGRLAYERALALFERAGDERGVGRVWNHLGTDAFQQARTAEARRCYDRALEAFRRAGLPGEEANILRNAVFLPDLSPDEKLQLIATAVERARIGGARVTEGLALHSWGDLLFMKNRYADSKLKLDEALTILGPLGGGRELARLYTSLGRLYRVHGDAARALGYYEQAFARQRTLRDVTGEIQSLNAMALALSIMGRQKDAASRYEESLALARSARSPQLGFILQQLGAFHVDSKRYTRGVALLEEALTFGVSGADRARALTSLTRAYSALGRGDAAGAAADQAVASARESGDIEARRQAHYARARVASAAGRTKAALDDARECLRLIERLRPNLLPVDPLKLSFGERSRRDFDFIVPLLMKTGLVEEAFVVSEQGRARAFLDLLASQQPDGKLKDRAELAALTAAADARTKLDPTVPDTERWAHADPELKSFVAAEAPSMERLKETVRRLHSTVISYWVTPDSTFAWVLSPNGALHGVRIRVAAARLSELVRSTWSPPTSSSLRTVRGIQSPGADRLTIDGQPAFRELYDILIKPVRTWLPRGNGPLVTIVPHGSLLRLSFAALQNERGKYLVEGYQLHYTPALSVLELTQRKKTDRRAERLLLVANPSVPTAIRAAERLPPLPGARREADAIARVSRGGTVQILTGTEARESSIRDDAATWTTIHFAAHAIVSDQRPLDSHLVLAGASDDPADDGRLTAQEIYSLDLRADLVVLSACRTASGRITGDGIVGLTRAFIYAGSPSVIAAAWDLADETAPQLFEAFYAERVRGADHGAALRASQLKILRALRTGLVAVTTPAGRFTVPEHPSIWAGLQLWGEP